MFSKIKMFIQNAPLTVQPNAVVRYEDKKYIVCKNNKMYCLDGVFTFDRKFINSYGKISHVVSIYDPLYNEEFQQNINDYIRMRSVMASNKVTERHKLYKELWECDVIDSDEFEMECMTEAYLDALDDKYSRFM